jgi:hypothetical protein
MTRPYCGAACFDWVFIFVGLLSVNAIGKL